MSCDNSVSVIITSVLAATIAIVSEFLPFIPGVEGNGIVHTIFSALRKKFPLAGHRQTVVSIAEPESTVIPEENLIETASV